jgi:hypothetical protein
LRSSAFSAEVSRGKYTVAEVDEQKEDADDDVLSDRRGANIPEGEPAKSLGDEGRKPCSQRGC